MKNHHLTPAQIELLALLSEQLGGAVQAVGEVLRHGYDKSDPAKHDGATSRGKLETALGNVRATMIMLCESEGVSKEQIHFMADYKIEQVKKHLRYQEQTKI